MNLPPAFGDDLEAMGQVDQSEGTTDGLNMFEKKRMERTHHVLEILWILFVLAMFSHTVPSKEEFRCEAIACCWFSSNLMKPYRYQIPLGFVQKLLITPKVVSFFGINEQIRPVLIEHPRVMSPLFPSVFFASLFLWTNKCCWLRKMLVSKCLILLAIGLMMMMPLVNKEIAVFASRWSGLAAREAAEKLCCLKICGTLHLILTRKEDRKWHCHHESVVGWPKHIELDRAEPFQYHWFE